jgi:transposase-like protein
VYLLQSIEIHCPYCGEAVEIVVDASLRRQRYIEDCPVCCRPIRLDVSVDAAHNIEVQAAHEDDC